MKPDAALYAELHTILQNIAKAPNVNLVFTFQPLGAPAVEKGIAKGGNVANIPAEQQSCTSPSTTPVIRLTPLGLGIMTQWTSDADDVEARSQIAQLIEELTAAAKKRGLLLDFLFQNDASYTQSPLRSYGDESLGFLNDMAEKYDPEGVFQKLQNSGFLISRA